MNFSTNAVISAIMMVTGPPIAANAILTVPRAVATAGATVIIAPMDCISVPMIIITGPNAARIAITATITVCVAGDRLLNRSVRDFTVSASCSNNGAIASSAAEPSSMPAFFTAFKLSCAFALGVLSVSRASATFPVESCIFPNSSLKAPTPDERIDNAPVPASLELHKPARASESPFTLSFRIPRTSPRLMPSFISCPKDFPVLLFRISPTSEPESPNSFSMLFRYVPACAVATPFFVNCAYDAARFSIFTP